MPLGCGEIFSAKGGEKGRQEEVGGALYGPCLTYSCLLICVALPSFTTTETSLPVPQGLHQPTSPFPGDADVDLDLGVLPSMKRGSGSLGHLWLMGCLSESHKKRKFSC